MLELLQRLFGRDAGTASKAVAKERLHLVLVHDRTDISPHILDDLKEDLIKVVSEYMDIDRTGLEVKLNTSPGSVALMASIPIRRIKRVHRS
ncbi:MAG: cell division topological specificity factor MinE [Clostridia bacterium]|nr:cell division topological specificity factor MinE [Clostridia bacterium]